MHLQNKIKQINSSGDYIAYFILPMDLGRMYIYKYIFF